MLIPALFLIENTGNNPCTHQQVNANKYWYIYTWGYYFIMQINYWDKEKVRLTSKTVYD